MHITFMPVSDGSSVYSTDNEDVQYGIEHHYRFGSLFYLDESCLEVADVVKEEPKEEESKIRVIKVSDIAMAKDYLADTFGISRTLLRSEKAIKEQAANKGIEFEGI